jgi:hypothetical protein
MGEMTYKCKPTISTNTFGTYVYTVAAVFPGFPASTVATEITFKLSPANVTPSPTATSRPNTNTNDSNIGEDDGVTEDPYANLSITKSKNSKYLIKVTSNLSEEDFLIRATKKGMITIKYNKQTDADGVISFYTSRNLSGYTVILYFDGQKFDSFKVN